MKPPTPPEPDKSDFAAWMDWKTRNSNQLGETLRVVAQRIAEIEARLALIEEQHRSR